MTLMRLLASILIVLAGTALLLLFNLVVRIALWDEFYSRRR